MVGNRTAVYDAAYDIGLIDLFHLHFNQAVVYEHPHSLLQILI